MQVTQFETHLLCLPPHLYNYPFSTKRPSIISDDAYGDDWTYHGGQNETVNLVTSPARASDVALTSLRFMGPRSYISPQQFLFVPPSFQIINGIGALTNGSTTTTLSNSGFNGWTGDFLNNDDWSYQDFWTATTGTKYVSDGILVIGSTQYNSFGLPLTLPYGTTQSFFIQRDVRVNDIILQKTFYTCCVPGKVYYVTFWVALSTYWNSPSTLKVYLEPRPITLTSRPTSQPTSLIHQGSLGHPNTISPAASTYGRLLVTMDFAVASLTSGSGWVQVRTSAFTATSNNATLIFAMTPDMHVGSSPAQAVAVTDIVVVGATPVPAAQTFNSIRTLLQPQYVNVDYLVNNVLSAGGTKFTSAFTICDNVAGSSNACPSSPVPTAVFNSWNTGWTFVGYVSIESHAPFTVNVNQMPYSYQGRISDQDLSINPYSSHKSLSSCPMFINLV